MSINFNPKIADAVKAYDLTDNTESVPGTFSTEFENKMERFIKRKQRSYKIHKIVQRSVIAVFTIALVGSLFYLLLLPQNEEGFSAQQGDPSVSHELPHDTSDNPAQDDVYVVIDSVDDLIDVNLYIDNIYSGDSVCVARIYISEGVTFSIQAEAGSGSTVFSGLKTSADEVGMSGEWYSYSNYPQAPHTSTIPFIEIAQGFYYLYIGNSGLDELKFISVQISSNSPNASIELLIDPHTDHTAPEPTGVLFIRNDEPNMGFNQKLREGIRSWDEARSLASFNLMVPPHLSGLNKDNPNNPYRDVELRFIELLQAGENLSYPCVAALFEMPSYNVDHNEIPLGVWHLYFFQYYLGSNGNVVMLEKDEWTVPPSSGIISSIKMEVTDSVEVFTIADTEIFSYNFFYESLYDEWYGFIVVHWVYNDILFRIVVPHGYIDDHGIEHARFIDTELLSMASSIIRNG